MMATSRAQSFAATPYGASFLLPPEDQKYLFEFYMTMPAAVRAHLAAEETGKKLQALLKRHGVAVEEAPKVAVTLWYDVVGQQNSEELAAQLKHALKTPLSAAKKLAQDIEDEVLTPISAELKEYRRQAAERNRALAAAYAGLPEQVKTHLAAETTADKLRTLLERQGLAPDLGGGVAATIFSLLTEIRDFAALPDMLAEALNLPADQAGKLAEAVEAELLSPVRKDIEQYWQGGGKTNGGRRRGASTNVLDLKKRKRLPPPPPMPRRST